MINNDEECIEFYNQNLKGKKFSIKYIEQKYPIFNNYVRHRFTDITGEEKFKDLIYRIENKLEEIPKCPICGKSLKFINTNPPKYQTYCSNKCKYSDKAREFILYKTRQTNLKRYGVENPMQCNKIKEKSKQTNLERYGVENPMQLNFYKEKLKHTMLEKYGVENSQQSKEVRDKVKQTCLDRYGCTYPLQNKKIMEKTKQTNLKRYGVENPQQVKEFREKTQQTCLKKYNCKSPMKLDIFKEKIKQTCLEKYGIESPMQLDLFKEKQKQTCLKKYGVEYPSKIEIIRQKIKETCLKKYGVDHPFKNKEIVLKAFNTRYSKKIAKFSKKEDEVYNYLITIDKDIKRQYYSELYPFHCDFYLPKFNVYIEYQGSWVHGFHPFNKDDENDIALLETWKKKAENSKFYKKAIYTWTVSDELKRKTAKDNNLKYLEIFPKDSFKDIINSYLKI